ncbi:putative isoflavone reductase family protein [Phaeomoniella chlamydospora]|uniref:Putative isoflavone reductase family protein n=1 Tax=Phaeomoniella chlamydospora TaxID=158046 RepID=A0A0G2GXI9_PHACM|nr:putative isoflavone reductase family protein [Phaeomoniella chlamydospora]
MSLPTLRTTPQGTVPFSHPCLIGATGTLGRKILDALLDQFHATSISLILRKKPEAGGIRQHSFPVDIRAHYVSDYADSEEVTKALQGCDVLISALSHKASHCELILVKAAIAAGVRRYMPSEYTVNIDDAEYRTAGTSNPISKGRIEWADQLRQIAVDEEKIEFTTIVPCAFIDYCLETGWWGFNIKKQTVPTKLAQANSPRTGCTLDFTAEAVAMSLRMPPERTRNKRIHIAETTYTGKDILSALERVTSSSEWTITPDASTQSSTTETDPQPDPQPDPQAQSSDAEYEDFVITKNFDDSPSGYLPDGLEWNKDGEFVIRRKTLDQIVEMIIRGPEDIDQEAFNGAHAQYQMPVSSETFKGAEREG